MKRRGLILLVVFLLACCGCSTDEDEESNGDEEVSSQWTWPLSPGEVPFVISGELPVPTHRYEDFTQIQSLDGTWLFLEDPDGVGDAQQWFDPDADRSGWRTIQVPGVFTAAFPDLFEYEGVGWYALDFDFEGDPRRTLIRFGSVFLRSQVYLNGERIGSHDGGYTPFHLLAGQVLREGANTLVVRADNTIGTDTIPAWVPFHDGKHGWWPHGGISGSVTLHRAPDPWIFKIEPRFVGAEGPVELTFGLLHFSQKDGETVAWSLQSPSGEIREGSFNLFSFTAGLHFYRLTLDAGLPEVWSRETPDRLYTLAIRGTVGGDEAAVRFGYRTVEVVGTQIRLNGQRDFWWGINRHSDYPDTGSVENPATVAREIGLIGDLHAVHVRPGHYPVAPLLLDALCDAGVTVMEEVPVYQLFGDQLSDPVLVEQSLLQLGEMIERDKNNPAILAWDVGNEYSSYLPGAKPFTAEMADYARWLDPSRPVACVITSVPCVVPVDFALSEVDIIGLNQYYGWYIGTVDKAGACLDAIHGMYPNHPVVATEFGAGCLAGIHLEGEPGNEPLDDHSYAEEWQAWYLEQQLSQLLARDYIAGVMPWVLADFRMQWDQTTGDPHPAYKTNLKGLVTQDRATRKLAFDAVSAIYDQGH